MSKKAAIPDAWDDEWESLVDEGPRAALDQVAAEPTLTKAERLAQHAETNKRIWRSAEEAGTFHYLTVHDNVPLKSDFKPALTLLSRKPAPRMIEKFDPVTGLAQLTLENEQDETEPHTQLAFEELKLKAQRDREEKQKKYEIARARILGTTSKNSSSENTAEIKPTSSGEPIGAHSYGSGRGSGRKIKGDANPGSPRLKKVVESPNPKKREIKGIIRAPRGPDTSERGGSGFATRGGKLH
ncbi:hypothetical protein K3495_g1311 [Podosphaera aphanis]|nr:hypothetical protein K3495_g1311 [Podosphaera aphanis]